MAMSSTTFPDRIRWDIVFTAPICSEARPGMGLIVLDRHELSNLTARNRQRKKIRILAQRARAQARHVRRREGTIQGLDLVVPFIADT